MNLLKYQHDLSLKSENGKIFVLDIIRKKYLRLLPEEMVRQLCILYLVNEKGYAKKLIKLEQQINFNGQVRRYDILTLTNQNEPYLLVECKAPNIKLTQKVLDQISHYNLNLKVPYLWITNGERNYCFELLDGVYTLLDEIPMFIS